MAGLGYEETELRLGLPGGGSDAAGDAAAARKRGFEETIDLKLKLEQPASSPAARVEKEAEEDGEAEEEAVAAADVVAAASPAASATGGAGGNNMKRSPSQSSVVTADDDAQPDPEKPRAPKYVAPPCSIASRFLFSFRPASQAYKLKRILPISCLTPPICLNS